MECSSITTSLHAFKRMVSRKITPSDIKEVVEKGEIIKDYPDDIPYPSVLLFKIINNRPLHVVVGKNEISSQCIIITVYIAGKEFWQPDFKTKK